MLPAHKLSFLIVLALFHGITTISACEPPRERWTKDDIFRELRKSTEMLLDTDFGKSQAVNLQGILKNAQYLEKELNKQPDILKEPSQFLQMYLLQLTTDAWQMRGLADAVTKTPPDTVHGSQIISDVTNDIFAKAQYGQSGDFSQLMAVYGGEHPTPTPGETLRNPFSGVNVKIVTLDKNGNEVRNCEVWFCLKGVLPYKDRYVRFDKLSSPSSQVLPPGNYVIWTRKDLLDGPQAFVQDVGEDGSQEREIHVRTP
jgi:hypothetical protein